jgi:hypothetical protein
LLRFTYKHTLLTLPKLSGLGDLSHVMHVHGFQGSQMWIPSSSTSNAIKATDLPDLHQLLQPAEAIFMRRQLTNRTGKKLKFHPACSSHFPVIKRKKTGTKGIA